MTEDRPERIGRYVITGVLGAGGMGVVYAATDDLLDREVAVKVLHRDRADDERSRERFWREARLAARVNHPGICQLYDVGDVNGQLFLAMERLEGESVAARLRRGALSVNESIQVALQVLEALEVLHRYGIIHRDLKPSNIFLTSRGAKVLDFGVARAEVHQSSVTQVPLTEAAVAIGTLRYMPPEQLLGSTVDPRADLFAVGATLYEMLAGAPAFDAATDAALINQILHGQVRSLAGSPSITAADRVVQRALAKSVEQRYPSANAMAEDLRLALVSDGTTDDRRPRPVTRIMVFPFRLLREDADIAFLAFSLADGIASSLSVLDTLVVRSPLAAHRFVTEIPDLAVIAKEGEVEAVLTGTVLRAGETIRVGAQLLEVPSGTVLWSHTSRVSLDDLFELEDRLVHEIVDSLTLPLSGRDRQALRSDVPASAKAYEFYLRANPLSYDSRSWAIARDLYRQCVQMDPQYAPAWARLGRLYRLLAKFPQPPGTAMSSTDACEQVTLAEVAFNRALALNPDLPLADSYYAQLELDLGRSQEAMVRLLRRATARSNDADLFAALVSACRYCGLLQASFAAHDRARRLDPNIRTSLTHTCFMAGDYLRAAEESERHWQTGNMGGLALLSAGHPDAMARLAQEAQRYGDNQIIPALVAGDRPGLHVAIDITLATFPDPEFHFYSGLLYAYSQAHDRAIDVLASAVQRGFFSASTLRRHPWLDPLRPRADFQAVLQEAEGRHQNALAAFIEAGGHRLLGVAVSSQ